MRRSDVSFPGEADGSIVLGLRCEALGGDPVFQRVVICSCRGAVRVVFARLADHLTDAECQGQLGLVDDLSLTNLRG